MHCLKQEVAQIMSNVSIGVTAMELFAYNPFRILGIAVNTPHAEIDRVYNELLRMADSGDIANYTTPFDFSSLPPFSRSAQTIKTAYAKLASTGYRCFAYSDSEFSASLNIDDIALNLRDITCYDCFLRCYMWLIINDREMQEHDLWIQLAAYIDKLIMSSPEEWGKYFDDRFPKEMLADPMSVYKSFYATFSEIILLPIKEMVRGSMKCTNATQILECAGIDVNEQFDYIDIPQANAPRPGEPAPKLKIALKDGEEYFDISTGVMKHYSTDTEAAESNSFAGSSFAPLAADDIITNEPANEDNAADTAVQVEESVQTSPADEAYTADTYEEPVQQTIEQPVQAAEQPAPEAPAKFERKSSERRVLDRSSDGVAAPRTERKAPPKPTQTITPKPEPLKLDETAAPNAAPAKPSAPAPAPAPVQRRSFRASAAQGEAAPAPRAQQSNFSSDNPFFKIDSNNAGSKDQDIVPAKPKPNSFTNIVKEAERKEEEAYASSSEDEENLFTNALIEMLKTNQARGETMKSVDTKHVKLSEKELTAPSPSKVSMSEISMDKYDENRLATGTVKVGEKLTREQRYRNIKIDDMLGTNNPNKSYAPSAIDEYKKRKEKEKANRRSLFAMVGVLAVALGIFALMWYFGIL